MGYVDTFGVYRRTPKPNRSNVSRQLVWTFKPGPCPYCHDHMPDEETATVDHIVPRSRGGENTRLNLLWCCERCNSAKGDKTPDEMRWSHERLIRRWILASLRGGTGLDGAWGRVRSENVRVGRLGFEEIVRRACVRIGIEPFSTPAHKEPPHA